MAPVMVLERLEKMLKITVFDGALMTRLLMHSKKILFRSFSENIPFLKDGSGSLSRFQIFKSQKISKCSESLGT